MSGTKGKSGQFLDPLDSIDRGLEVVRSVGHHAAQETKKQINVNETGKTFLEQLLGMNLKKDEHGAEKSNQAHEAAPANLNHGEIFDRATHHASAKSEQPKAHHAEKARPHAEAAINYHEKIKNNRKEASQSELSEMQRNIEEIKRELSKLVASSQVLKLEFADVGVEQSTKSVGQYHLNFFEWMLAVIRSAREKVEDSGAWLGTVKGKGAKKDYWGMFKQHGTTFGLSGERSVATSVG